MQDGSGIPWNPPESLGIPWNPPPESLGIPLFRRRRAPCKRRRTRVDAAHFSARDDAHDAPRPARGLRPRGRPFSPPRASWPRTAPTSKRTATKNPNFRNDFFEARPGRRAGVGNVGKAASQRPRRPRIAAPVQAQELAAARRRLASFKPVCQRGMSEISPPARRNCSRGRTCRHPNRTLARAEKGARQNLPQNFPQKFNTQI